MIVWNPTSGEQLAQLKGHTDWVRSVSWNGDGSSEDADAESMEGIYVQNLKSILAKLQELENEIDRRIFNIREQSSGL